MVKGDLILNNELQEQHVMVLENTHSSGVEEWHCPICGRRILMQWPPNYKKVTLEAGDEYAVHSIAKGGLAFGTPQISQEISSEDNARLTQWDVWLGQIGFDSWWNQNP